MFCHIREDDTITQQQSSLNILKFSYLSTFVAIFVATLLAQVLIQSTLLQERHSRMVAAIMDVQETRSQRLFRDSLLLLAPNATTAQLVQEMQTDHDAIERVNTGILVGNTGLGIAPTDFSSEELAKVRAAQPAEQAIMEASAQIVEMEKKHAAPKEIIPSVTTLFYKEPIYFLAIKYLFDTLNSDADAHVQAVQLIEIGLYGFFVLLLIVEAVVVALPAWKQLKDALDDLAQQANQE